jgi:predicted ABC-class ATPase
MAKPDNHNLLSILRRIDGRGYKAYQDIKGVYQFETYDLEIAHVQGDPYAPPSRVAIAIDLGATDLSEFTGERRRLLGLEDYLGRSLARQIHQSGSRDISIDRYGQEMLRRTSVRIRGDHLEVRLFIQLPASGRRIRAPQAEQIFFSDLPTILERALLVGPEDRAAIMAFQNTLEDYLCLQDHLAARGWIAFIADQSLLPRRAGHDDRPLSEGAEPPPVRFESPSEFAATVPLPHGGEVRGMAISTGVTLLVGGGFHGKSTLLDAIARGIYPHIPGDGRERIAANPLTLKVRAEDGRAVTGTDISAFINNLPFNRSTIAFTTQNASGSTSQAANIIEGIEAGAEVLLLDEDTSATNFMIRDEMMRRLLKPGQEPITPFLDRVGNLQTTFGVSTILVVGGSGEYFKVADRVIQMDRYRPVDVTAEAQAICGGKTTSRAAEFTPTLDGIRRLRLDRYRRKFGPKGARVKAVGTARIVAIKEEIDLCACEQLVSPSQTRFLCEILTRLLEGRGGDSAWRDLYDGFTPSRIREILVQLGDEQLDRSSYWLRGDLAEVRALEVIAALNRLRELKVEQI